ncbi:MAG: YitT family protein [Bacteroidetes bacterium]|nr:YitT family protein [Bacteroidota bacterium]
MNPIFQQIILNNARRSKSKNADSLNNYDLAKEFYKLKITFMHTLKGILLISIGVLSAGFGLESFLLPNSFIDGGVTGISLLTSEVTGWPLPLLIVLINLPFIVLGYRQMGSVFAIKSILAIAGLALAITFVNYPVITSDKLLVSVFGGFFLGAGIGFAVRGGAVLDGTEVLAIYLTKKTGMTMGDIILIFNILIFSVAAYLLSIEVALYSILTYMSAAKTVDFVVEGVEEYIGVTVISTHSEEIRLMITEKMGRGVTIYSGKRGYGKRGDNLNDIDVVYSVITRLEIGKIQAEIEKIDPNAFIVMNSVKDTKGGMIKKRPLNH